MICYQFVGMEFARGVEYIRSDVVSGWVVPSGKRYRWKRYVRSSIKRLLFGGMISPRSTTAGVGLDGAINGRGKDMRCSSPPPTQTIRRDSSCGVHRQQHRTALHYWRKAPFPHHSPLRPNLETQGSARVRVIIKVDPAGPELRGRSASNRFRINSKPARFVEFGTGVVSPSDHTCLSSNPLGSWIKTGPGVRAGSGY